MISFPKIDSAQLELLERLSNAFGVSGDEGEVRKIILEQIRPLADELKIDALGNVLATKIGRRRDRVRVMLAAHMDEVGFILTYEDGAGAFRFETVGGVRVDTLVGKSVWIGRDRVPGVIGTKPVHLSTDDEQAHRIPLEALRIDVGPGNQNLVKIGDRAVFATEFDRPGASLRGKALDDRLGVATLITLFGYAPEHIDLLAAFTVQEEVGLRGAHVAAYTLDPDLAIVLDCTPANDMPSWDGIENIRYNTRLGAGPAIYLADRGTISDSRLVKHFVVTAEQSGIPFQYRQPGGGTTDAAAIQKQRAGIPIVSVSVPGRYLHTPISIARFEDWVNSMALIHAALVDLQPRILAAD